MRTNLSNNLLPNILFFKVLKDSVHFCNFARQTTCVVVFLFDGQFQNAKRLGSTWKIGHSEYKIFFWWGQLFGTTFISNIFSIFYITLTEQKYDSVFLCSYSEIKKINCKRKTCNLCHVLININEFVYF